MDLSIIDITTQVAKVQMSEAGRRNLSLLLDDLGGAEDHS